MATAKAIRPDQPFSRYCDSIAAERVLRSIDQGELIPAISDAGRYQVSVDLCFDSRVASASTRCDDIEVARATLAAFKRQHADDRNALGGIYDTKTFSYVETWRGGEAFGPADKRHPLERIFGKLIAKGDRVRLIDPRGIRTFNGGQS